MEGRKEGKKEGKKAYLSANRNEDSHPFPPLQDVKEKYNRHPYF